jgi:hypothetical protein
LKTVKSFEYAGLRYGFSLTPPPEIRKAASAQSYCTANEKFKAASVDACFYPGVGWSLRRAGEKGLSARNEKYGRAKREKPVGRKGFRGRFKRPLQSIPITPKQTHANSV